MAEASKRIKAVKSEGEFEKELQEAGNRLVVAEFFSTECPFSEAMQNKFYQLCQQYDEAVFLKVDLDEYAEAAITYRVDALPAYLLFKEGKKLCRIIGADGEGLEGAICSKYKETVHIPEQVQVPADQVELSFLLDDRKCECLNQDDDYPFTNSLQPGPHYLQSDCDAQLIVALVFKSPVKLHSLQLTGPNDGRAPKRVKLFINQPQTLDFDQAESLVPTQQFCLTEADVQENSVIPLKFVHFQIVHSLTIFVKDNQGDEETSVINDIRLFGTPRNIPLHTLEPSPEPDSDEELAILIQGAYLQTVAIDMETLLDKQKDGMTIMEKIAPFWEQLAQKIGMKPGICEALAMKHHGADDACKHMFQMWLMGNAKLSPIWEVLTQKLREINLDNIAKQLEEVIIDDFSEASDNEENYASTKMSSLHCFMVCAETTFHITGTSAHCCSWTGYGFRLHFPEQTVSADQMPCSLHVGTSLPSVDQFILPPDSVPVSSFYDITGPLLEKPLKMEIEHCAKQSHYTTLSFVVSREDNPFKFDFLDSGSFPEDSSYGSVSVLHFTKFGIVAKKFIKFKQRILHGGESVEPARSSASNISEVSTPEECGQSYCARVFHRALKRGKLWYFAITFNLEVCKTFLTKTYEDQNAEPGPDQPVEFEESMIEFIPEGSDFERNDFSVSTNGWKISAPFYPGVTKKEVDLFSCGKRIPSCQLQADWSKTEEKPGNKLSQIVTMKGAKKPYNFFKIEYDSTSKASLAKLTLPETSMATEATFCKACKCHTVYQENPGTFCIDGFLTEWERKIYDERTLDVLKNFCTDVGKAFVLDQKQHFRAVRSALVAVAEKWDKIGSALQLQRSKLRSIKSDNHSRVDACLNAMIAQWFAETSTSSPPTLRRLIGAIATKVGGQNPAHAEFIAANFNKIDDMEKLPITGVKSNVLTADDDHTEVCANLVNEGLEHNFMEIGIFLGIDYKKLYGLKDISDMIDLWLEKSYNTELFGEPSWLNLVKAVGSKVGAGDMSSAERIARRHGYTIS